VILFDENDSASGPQMAGPYVEMLRERSIIAGIKVDNEQNRWRISREKITEGLMACASASNSISILAPVSANGARS